MKRIYKYPIEIRGINTVRMPAGAEILDVQMQNGIPTIWAMVNPEVDEVDKTIHIWGTGHPIPDDFEGKYITTFQERVFVWHVFEVEI